MGNVAVALAPGRARFAPRRSTPSERFAAPAADRFVGVEQPKLLSDFAPENGRRLARTLRGRHQEWQANSIIPVLVAWLIFYSIAIVGALTGVGRSL